MEHMNLHRLRGSAKVLSALIGASVVLTMGAATVAYSANEANASTASANSVIEPKITPSTPRSEPKIAFASPPVKASHVRNGRPIPAQANCFPEI